MKARVPRNELFVATAVHERPGLASTRYANVLVYIHLKVDVRAIATVNRGSADIDENPMSTSMVQMAATWACFSHTQA